MDGRLLWIIVLHAMGTTAGLLLLFRAGLAVTGGSPTAAVRRDYAVGGLLVIVGLALRFLLARTAAPSPLADLPADLLRPAGAVLALAGTVACLWALSRTRPDAAKP